MPDQSFLNLKQSDLDFFFDPSTLLFEFEMTFELGSRLHIEKRTRYSLWDLVADVGGFNDGIMLVCSIFMSAYSAMAF